MTMRRMGIGVLVVMGIYAAFWGTNATAANNKNSTLATAVLLAPAGLVLNCEATNVSGEPRTISVQIFGEGGNSLKGPVTNTVADGSSAFATYNQGAYAYCKITVNGPASDVRAALAVHNAENGTNGVALAY